MKKFSRVIVLMAILMGFAGLPFTGTTLFAMNACEVCNSMLTQYNNAAAADYTACVADGGWFCAEVRNATIAFNVLDWGFCMSAASNCSASNFARENDPALVA